MDELREVGTLVVPIAAGVTPAVRNLQGRI